MEPCALNQHGAEVHNHLGETQPTHRTAEAAKQHLCAPRGQGDSALATPLSQESQFTQLPPQAPWPEQHLQSAEGSRGKLQAKVTGLCFQCSFFKL